MHSTPIRTMFAESPATALPPRDAGADEADMTQTFAMEPMMIDPFSEPARFAHVAAAATRAATRELGDFAAERLNAQADRIRAWSTVRTPAGWLLAELSFAAQALSSYGHEMAHLQQVILEAAEAAARDRD